MDYRVSYRPETSVTDRQTDWRTDRVQTYSPLRFHLWGTNKCSLTVSTFTGVSLFWGIAHFCLKNNENILYHCTYRCIIAIVNILKLIAHVMITCCVLEVSGAGWWSKLLACRAKGLGFNSRSCRYNFRDCLSPASSPNMAERSLKRHKSSKPTNQRCYSHQISECFCCKSFISVINKVKMQEKIQKDWNSKICPNTLYMNATTRGIAIACSPAKNIHG